VLKSSDRFPVVAYIAASILILAVAITLRVSTPSPFAPRVRVRWSPTVEERQRAVLERQFSLFKGERHEDETWEYDLVDPSPAFVAALVAHPDVADTHYIDRATGRVASDAPVGTLRVPERRGAAFVHSIVFDWFLLFWASSIVVSGVWLASGADTRD
jgi:hypothetical protein